MALNIYNTKEGNEQYNIDKAMQNVLVMTQDHTEPNYIVKMVNICDLTEHVLRINLEIRWQSADNPY